MQKLNKIPIPLSCSTVTILIPVTVFLSESYLFLSLFTCLCKTIQVIAAEGEQKASRALKEAADVITESPAAIQLRYLQTLNTISAEKNSTIIFPLPIDVLQGFMNPPRQNTTF
jgi:hypothetical protein